MIDSKLSRQIEAIAIALDQLNHGLDAHARDTLLNASHPHTEDEVTKGIEQAVNWIDLKAPSRAIATLKGIIGL